MEIVKLNLKRRTYNIIIGSNILGRLGKEICKLKLGDTAYIITNALIKNKYAGKLTKALKRSGIDVIYKTVPDSEQSKSIKISTQVIIDIARYDKKRRIFIIAFGGGVIGDLSGFIASIYKRGIPYIQIPTTLLAQVDSSIGGKTAVDLIEGKNLVGAFYQPRLVLSDVRLLNTLSKRQVLSGLAEVIKYGIIKDRQLFTYLERNYQDILDLEAGALEHVVTRCSLIKANIVEQDEKEEKEIRTILNFGHTIGHAIEAASSYKKHTHGEGIALGMLAAVDISRRLNLINQSISQRIEKLIKLVGLPIRIRKLPLKGIINAHYHDKKFIGKKNRFVLLEDIGKTKIVVNIPSKIIREAILRIGE